MFLYDKILMKNEYRSWYLVDFIILNYFDRISLKIQITLCCLKCQNKVAIISVTQLRMLGNYFIMAENKYGSQKNNRSHSEPC
jgi:hypothetical protein